MGDITDLFNATARTKVTPTKGYNANFSTSSTSFVDATSLSVSVPNGSYYVVRGVLNANSASSTTSLQVLLGASVVFTDSVTSGGGGGLTKTSDSLILFNNTGSTQTAKVQIKTDNGAHTGSVQTMSIIQGSMIFPFDANFYAIRESVQDITSLDFIICIGNGTSTVYFDSAAIVDTTTTATTWSSPEKFCNVIRFWGANVGYVAFDFTGKVVTL